MDGRKKKLVARRGAMEKPVYSTEHSRQLYERACKSLATGVSSGLRRTVTPTPLYFERGDGPYFFDADGHKLADYTLGWGPLIVGSNHPAINRAVEAQLRRGYTFGAQHQGESELAERICGANPGVEQAILASSGTEAVQAGALLTLARGDHAGRSKFVKFRRPLPRSG